MRLAPLWLAPLAGLCACTGMLASCSERPAAASSSPSTFISVTAPKEGWAGSIEYRIGEEGVPALTIDGVRFELGDMAAVLLDWEAIGMSGITTTSSFKYESTEPVEGAFLAVAGKGVEIRDGVLYWGDGRLGPVEAGDVVHVDAEGLRIEGR